MCNVTQNGQALTSNEGRPGDVLEYVVTFTNVGNAPISDVVIFDSTPEFTELNQVIQCRNGTIPVSLVCNSVTTDGIIKVAFVGSLQEHC